MYFEVVENFIMFKQHCMWVVELFLNTGNVAKTKSESFTLNGDFVKDNCIRIKRNLKICKEILIANKFYFLLTLNKLITVFNSLKQQVKL